MRYLAANCRNCGAPLDPPARSSAIRCEYCHARFERADEAIDRVDDNAAAARPPSLPAAVVELDREWEEYRRGLLTRRETGEYDIPEPEHCRMGIRVVMVVGAIGLAMLMLGHMQNFAVLWSLGAIGTMAVLRRQAEVGAVYQRSLANYHAARRALLNDAPVAGGAPLIS